MEVASMAAAEGHASVNGKEVDWDVGSSRLLRRTIVVRGLDHNHGQYIRKTNTAGTGIGDYLDRSICESLYKETGSTIALSHCMSLWKTKTNL